MSVVGSIEQMVIQMGDWTDLGEIRIKPWADGHHVRFSGQCVEVLDVGGVVLVIWTSWPGVPAQEAVDVGQGCCTCWTLAGVVRNEECFGLRFDVGPISGILPALER
jgi:hypothetical protein